MHFDMNKNRILAAGDQYHIKFWDMDNASLLDICDAEGGLPVSICQHISTWFLV